MTMKQELSVEYYSLDPQLFEKFNEMLHHTDTLYEYRIPCTVHYVVVNSTKPLQFRVSLLFEIKYLRLCGYRKYCTMHIIITHAHETKRHLLDSW